MTVPRKNLLRTHGPNRKYPLTGGAEAHNGTPDGTTERSESNELKRSEARKSEVTDAGCATKKTALPVDFVSTLFEIDSI